jgi:hypothetical protein
MWPRDIRRLTGNAVPCSTAKKRSGIIGILPIRRRYGTVSEGGPCGTASECDRSSEFISMGMAPHLRSAGNGPVLQHPHTPGPVPPLWRSVAPRVLVSARRAGWDLLFPGFLHRARLARWNREHRRRRNSADPWWTGRDLLDVVCSAAGHGHRIRGGDPGPGL